jgi:hypothetical protein
MSFVGKICGKMSPRRRRRRVAKPIEMAFTFNAKQCLYHVEKLCKQNPGKHKLTAQQYYMGAKLCVDSMVHHRQLNKHLVEHYKMKLSYIKHIMLTRVTLKDKAKLARKFRKSL